jgi:hypothetical protein
MILDCNPLHKKFRGFRFESFWLQYPDFKDTVKQSWSAPVVGNNKARTLHIKLSRLAKSLEKWHRLKMAENKRESLQSQQTVLQLDKLQDERPLTESEFMQRKEPKHRILGLEWVTQTPNSWKKILCGIHILCVCILFLLVGGGVAAREGLDRLERQRRTGLRREVLLTVVGLPPRMLVVFFFCVCGLLTVRLLDQQWSREQALSLPSDIQVSRI